MISKCCKNKSHRQNMLHRRIDLLRRPARRKKTSLGLQQTIELVVYYFFEQNSSYQLGIYAVLLTFDSLIYTHLTHLQYSNSELAVFNRAFRTHICSLYGTHLKNFAILNRKILLILNVAPVLSRCHRHSFQCLRNQCSLTSQLITSRYNFLI